MEKRKAAREITSGEINCLENLVVAYNTVFFLSSVVIIFLGGTVRELFSDFCRVLSPSLILFIIGCFVIFIAILGYVGIGKKSSSLLSLYTMLLVFVLIWEISAGFGILSFRREIRSVVSTKMKKTMMAYPEDPLTANLIDYAQLELQCCGVNSFRDWIEVLDHKYPTNCRVGDITLPPSCCTQSNSSSIPQINKHGCLPAINFMFHRSTLALTSIILTICTIQILGAYFSYTLARSINKYKMQTAANALREVPQYQPEVAMDYREKSNYF